MAGAVTPILRKVRKALIAEFPAPDTVKLEDLDGIIGVITSEKFAEVDTIGRQDLIGEILARTLNPLERRKVQVIVGVTPDEGTGYLSSLEPSRKPTANPASGD